MFLPKKPRKKKEGVHHKNKPENPDPEKWSVYWTKDGWVKRRKRGTVTPAKLNAVFSANAADTGSKEAKEILRVLSPFTKHIRGRKSVYLSTCVRQAKKQEGPITYEAFLEHEINYEFPLGNIYTGHYEIRIDKGVAYIDLPVNAVSVKRNNNLVTGYYFEFILLKGDAGEPDSMRSESDRSEIFSCKSRRESVCTLSLLLPEKGPYMTVLKFGSIEEEKYESTTARHYGLKIVGCG